MPDARTETFVIELKVGTDPLTRRGLPARDAYVRLRKLLKMATRECGFRVSWGQIPPPCPLADAPPPDPDDPPPPG